MLFIYEAPRSILGTTWSPNMAITTLWQEKVSGGMKRQGDQLGMKHKTTKGRETAIKNNFPEKGSLLISDPTLHLKQTTEQTQEQELSTPKGSSAPS